MVRKIWTNEIKLKISSHRTRLRLIYPSLNMYLANIPAVLIDAIAQVIAGWVGEMPGQDWCAIVPKVTIQKNHKETMNK